jgi:hypothetical protein
MPGPMRFVSAARSQDVPPERRSAAASRRSVEDVQRRARIRDVETRWSAIDEHRRICSSSTGASAICVDRGKLW